MPELSQDGQCNHGSASLHRILITVRMCFSSLSTRLRTKLRRFHKFRLFPIGFLCITVKSAPKTLLIKFVLRAGCNEEVHFFGQVHKYRLPDPCSADYAPLNGLFLRFRNNWGT